MKKPDCYKCKYRGTLAGSAHSCCKHPSFKTIQGDPLMKLASIFASVGRMPPVQAKSSRIKVKGNSHGISSGWFNHPFNFDPVWLEECTGFKKKKENEE